MRITPLDVRKQEFRKAVRGLDADEVHAFLATVADEYEFVLTDNKKLRDKVIELDEKVGEYRNMEKTLRDTLLTAERVMTEARQNARKEADLILRDAQMQATQEVSGINGRVEALHQQIRELRGHRDAYVARLQSLSEAQLGLIDSYRKDFETNDSRIERVAEPLRAPQARNESTSIPVYDQSAHSGGRAPVSDDHWRSYDVREDAPRSGAVAPVDGRHRQPDYEAPRVESRGPQRSGEVRLDGPEFDPSEVARERRDQLAPRFHTPDPRQSPQFEAPLWDGPDPRQEFAAVSGPTATQRMSQKEYDARVASVADAWSGSVPRVDVASLPQGDARAIDEVSAALGMFTEGGLSGGVPAHPASRANSTPDLAPGRLPSEPVQHASGDLDLDADPIEELAEAASAEQEDSPNSRWSLSRIARGITGG